MHVGSGDIRAQMQHKVSEAGRVARHALPRLAESVKSLATNLMARMGSAHSYQAMKADEGDPVAQIDKAIEPFSKLQRRNSSPGCELLNTALEALPKLEELKMRVNSMTSVSNKNATNGKTPLISSLLSRADNHSEKIISTLVSTNNVDSVVDAMYFEADETFKSATTGEDKSNIERSIKNTENALNKLQGLNDLIDHMKHSIPVSSSGQKQSERRLTILDSREEQIQGYRQQLSSRLNALNSKLKEENNIASLNDAVLEFSDWVEKYNKSSLKTINNPNNPFDLAVEKYLDELLNAIVSYNDPNISNQESRNPLIVKNWADSLFMRLKELTPQDDKATLKSLNEAKALLFKSIG